MQDFGFDRFRERPRHAVARGAGKAGDTEAQLLQGIDQSGRGQIRLGRTRTGRERGLDPGLALQAARQCVAGKQGGSNEIARIRGVGATGDGGDDHGALRQRSIGERLVALTDRTGDTRRSQARERHALVRIGRTGDGPANDTEVVAQDRFILGLRQGIGPQSLRFGVILDQFDRFRRAPGQAEVVDGLFIDGENRRGRTELWRHIGNRGAVGQ